MISQDLLGSHKIYWDSLTFWQLTFEIWYLTFDIWNLTMIWHDMILFNDVDTIPNHLFLLSRSVSQSVAIMDLRDASAPKTGLSQRKRICRDSHAFSDNKCALFACLGGAFFYIRASLIKVLMIAIQWNEYNENACENFPQMMLWIKFGQSCF